MAVRPRRITLATKLALVVLLATSACSRDEQASSVAESAAEPATTRAVTQILPADKLSAYKSALPKVAYPELQRIFDDPDTLWYDHDTMLPTYQDSVNPPLVGAQSNDDWFRLLAGSLHATGDQIYDRAKKRWRFPFATTAGTDDSTNMKVANFIRLPKDGGKTLPLAIWTDTKNGFSKNSWAWIYPNGTVIGEVMFIKDGQRLLPAEIRIRKRYADGWAMNAYRPFPEANAMADAVERQPEYQREPALKTFVAHLRKADTLTASSLKATGLKGTFDQSGHLDTLPSISEFPELVGRILKSTTFVSAYGAVWKQSGGNKTYAPTTKDAVSFVPNHYTAGLMEVSDVSCMRCHKDTARMLEEWHDDIVLYGEVWGKDGIFSFHPFDQQRYSSFLVNGVDNRRMNPKLKDNGFLETYDANKHKAPHYSRKQ